MKIRLTGTFVQEYEIEPEFYEAVTPQGQLEEDIIEYTMKPHRFVDDMFDLAVTGEVIQ